MEDFGKLSELSVYRDSTCPYIGYATDTHSIKHDVQERPGSPSEFLV